MVGRLSPRASGYCDYTALVIDMGSQTVRAGYAGEESPRQVWPSCVGFKTPPSSSSATCSSSSSSSASSSSSTSLSSSGSSAPSVDYRFPLHFQHRADNLELRPCLFRDPRTGYPVLEKEAFEILLYNCIEGDRLAHTGNAHPWTNRSRSHIYLHHTGDGFCSC
eukprot:GHVT01080452.1.p1 GENE.GHVT01080452.1~~GHVT01080452.1.p1  ORF type:complete len:164 (-),score=30.20 GHVT01080452.1:113-604(-)